jgi:hypothetical protein
VATTRALQPGWFLCSLWILFPASTSSILSKPWLHRRTTEPIMLTGGPLRACDMNDFWPVRSIYDADTHKNPRNFSTGSTGGSSLRCSCWLKLWVLGYLTRAVGASPGLRNGLRVLLWTTFKMAYKRRVVPYGTGHPLHQRLSTNSEMSGLQLYKTDNPKDISLYIRPNAAFPRKT